MVWYSRCVLSRFGGSSLGHSVEWGLPAVCAWCVRLSDPQCYMMIIIALI